MADGISARVTTPCHPFQNPPHLLGTKAGTHGGHQCGEAGDDAGKGGAPVVRVGHRVGPRQGLHQIGAAQSVVADGDGVGQVARAFVACRGASQGRQAGKGGAGRGAACNFVWRGRATVRKACSEAA